MLSVHLIKQTGVLSYWKLDETKFTKYVARIEAGYDPKNPYHNSIHAASVVQMTHMLLCHGGLMASGAIGKPQQIASYWSALVHDFEHMGLNNDFLWVPWRCVHNNVLH